MENVAVFARPCTEPAGVSSFQELPDGARCLSDPLIVFHQRETDVAFAHGAEADAGGDGYLGFLEQELGEFERAHGAEAFGQRRPEEHGAARLFDGPAGALETGDEYVAALLV